jgi:hypothetical protein
MRKPVVKKKIDFATDGESNDNQQQWNSQPDSFVFTPNQDPATSFVDATSQEFCFGSPDNDKTFKESNYLKSDSPPTPISKSNSSPNIQQTPLSTVHTPSRNFLSTPNITLSVSNGTIVTKPERVKVLRVPRSEKQRVNGVANVNPVANVNNNNVVTPQPTVTLATTTFQDNTLDEDDHEMGSVKRSKRKKDQVFLNFFLLF